MKIEFEKELKLIKQTLKEINKRYTLDTEDEDKIYNDQKKFSRYCDKMINKIIGETGSWANWASNSEDFYLYLLKAVKVGYNDALHETKDENNVDGEVKE